MTSWTPADLAEMDVMTWELVDSYFTHIERCETCQASRRRQGAPCVYLQSAISIVLDWRKRRQLATRAEELRLQRRALLEDAA